MLSISKPTADRLDIDLSGGFSAADMASALDDLFEKSEDISDGVMLYRITDIAMPSFGAIGVELQRLPSLFALIGKFRKCAVISDIGWIRTAAEIEGAVIPGLQIRSFQSHESAEAEAWLAEAG